MTAAQVTGIRQWIAEHNRRRGWYAEAQKARADLQRLLENDLHIDGYPAPHWLVESINAEPNAEKRLAMLQDFVSAWRRALYEPHVPQPDPIVKGGSSNMLAALFPLSIVAATIVLLTLVAHGG